MAPPVHPATAAEAAETARWSERKWVWIPDDKEGYVAGYVNRENDFEADDRSQVRRGASYSLSPPLVWYSNDFIDAFGIAGITE